MSSKTIHERTSAKQRRRLEQALCAIVDNEASVTDAMIELGTSERGIGEICRALRLIVDGEQ
jgi:hypothetical protein